MNDRFSQKAKTFALRSYWNFWNSESSADAYKILFNMGLSDKTMQDFAIGWNNKIMKRSASSFGTDGGNLEIPEGIVVPHLINKKVTGLRVFSKDLKTLLKLPEENFPPLCFHNKKKISLIFSSVFLGYLSVQNLSDKVNIIIAENIYSDEITKIIDSSGLVLIEESLKNDDMKITQKHIFFSDYDECLKIMDDKII